MKKAGPPDCESYHQITISPLSTHDAPERISPMFDLSSSGKRLTFLDIIFVLNLLSALAVSALAGWAVGHFLL